MGALRKRPAACGLPRWCSGKRTHLPMQWMQEMQVRSLEKGNSNPLQYFLPGKSHGQKSLVGFSPWGQKDWIQLSNWVCTDAACVSTTHHEPSLMSCDSHVGPEYWPSLLQVQTLASSGELSLSYWCLPILGLPAQVLGNPTPCTNIWKVSHSPSLTHLTRDKVADLVQTYQVWKSPHQM